VGSNTASNPVSTQQFLEQMTAQLDAADLFYGHGTDNGWDEACWLFETVLRRHGKADLHPDMPLDLESPELLEVRQLADERCRSRKPLAYLLHEAWFCGIPFYVDERVLVPRSPIAELIHNQFEPLLPRPPVRILDLCTGGGCIGLACALAFPDAEVVLSDISPEALAVAAVNVEKLGLGARVRLVQSDLFNDIDGSFDLIVSNPPYVAEDEYLDLPEEFLREPRLGLVSELQGLDIPLRILAQAADYLRPHGALVLETGATWPLLDEACPQLDFLWIEFDYGGEGVCFLTREKLQAQPR
jgi:ribosomal protein L3 glutamine methyltransferase